MIEWSISSNRCCIVNKNKNNKYIRLGLGPKQDIPEDFFIEK